MKLFLIAQDENSGYDTYDSAVVAAPDEETARQMNPSNGEPVDWSSRRFDDWASEPHQVTVRYLGEADGGVEQGVVCASYNAG